MVFQKGGRPSPCKAGDDLPIEPPTKAPDQQFTAKRPPTQGAQHNRAHRRYLDADARRARDRGQINTRSTSWARDDREWFQRWPDRSHRVRDRFPGEEFGSRDDPTLDMVAVRQISTGVRVRSPFEIPASPAPDTCVKPPQQSTALRSCSTWQ